MTPQEKAEWQAQCEDSHRRAETRRQHLLGKLAKYRQKGWEKEVLPYGIPFREDERTLNELSHHITKIERAHRERMKENIMAVLKLIGIILFLWLVINK